jgi:hypothetical protein
MKEEFQENLVVLQEYLLVSLTYLKSNYILNIKINKQYLLQKICNKELALFVHQGIN